MKKNFLFLCTLIFLPFIQKSQYRWDFGGGLGVSNYLGDIGGNQNTRRDFVSDIKMAKTKFNLSGFARMNFYGNKKMFLKMEFNYLQIEGFDKLSSNPGRKYRNLDFRNNIFEFTTTVQYVLYQNLRMGSQYRRPNQFRVYAFGGLGVFHHNPKGLYNGQWIELRPLMTEAQKKPYSKYGVCIPLGLGFSYTYKKRHRFSFEMNWRTTFTDYLDDISTTYADPNALSSTRAQVMSNKTDVVDANAYQTGFSNNFLPGSKRGDASHNDSYLTANFSYSFVLRGSSRNKVKRWWDYHKNTGNWIWRRGVGKF